MTTGSDVVDQRFYIGTERVGTYFERTWSGVNQVRVPYPPPARPFRDYGKLVRALWRRPPKRGRANGEHPYTMSLRSFHDSLIGYRAINGGAVSYGTSDNWAVPTFHSAWTSNDDLILIGKLREKILGSGFDVAIAGAELGESLGMILHAARALDGAYRHAKRGDFASAGKSIAGYERSMGRGVKAVSKVASNGWLANQFGVQPLLSDVYNAAQTIAHLTSVPLQKTYTVARRRGGVVTPSSPTLVEYTEKEGFEGVKIKAIIKEVNVLGALGLNNPAGVLWEKLPYSFVIDWFLPVGNYLEALGLAKNLTGTFVTSRIVKYAANGISFKASSGNVIVSGGGDVRYRYVTLVRTVSTSLDVPMPSYKPLAKSATLSHVTSTLSLLRQHL